MSLISCFVPTKLNVSFEDTNEDVCNLKYRVLNLFQANFSFLYSLKKDFKGYIRGYINETLARNGLKHRKTISEKQKQPSRGVLRKRCSQNMQQIYKRTPMPKCDFNKVALEVALQVY